MDTLTGSELGDNELEDEGAQPPRPEKGAPRPMAYALAAMSLGAAVIHAAFAPSHFSETWSHGAFFMASAWFQLLLAYLLVTRRSRWVYALGLLNAIVIGAWVMSRTIGAPFGPDAWVPEDVGFPDVLATDFEAFIVLGCLGLLFGRAWRGTGHWTRTALAGTTALVLVVAGLTTASRTPRFAGSHTHDHGTAAGAGADGHVHTPSQTAGFVLTGTTPCEKSGPPASDGSIQDAEGHNHRGPVEQLPIDEPTREALVAQQALALGAAERYPTVADAEAAGYAQSTPFVPCIGAHYTNISFVGGFDPAKPSELLFDGTRPDSRIIGLSYLVFHPGGAQDGFAGPNDHWHQHNSNGGLCFSKANGIVIGAEQLTPEQCAAINGVKRPLPDIWMLHDWIVPGWECGWGVFAPECPELGGTPGKDAFS